jgi:uncharacterized membrane protein
MPSRTRILRIHPPSAAKVLGLLYGAMALIAALFLAVGHVVGGVPKVQLQVVILLPFIYGFGGMLLGLIVAGVYNMIAAAVGGIVIDLADEAPREPL